MRYLNDPDHEKILNTKHMISKGKSEKQIQLIVEK